MRPRLPTLGEPPRRRSGPTVLLLALAIAGGAGGYWFWWWKGRAPQAPAASEVAQAPTAPAPAEGTPPPAEAAPAPAAPREDPVAAAGLQHVAVRVAGPLETAFVEAVGPDVGPALVQVVTRTLVWWVQVPRDLVRGDTVEVLYETRPAEEPLVHAVRFTSGKTGQVHRAFRVQLEGAAQARYFLPSGEELEERLVDSPVDEYEQITSLLRDGRGHKGVDFRTPVGTPVKAPFNGVVVRKNWNWRSNGNCVELRETGGRGRRALFLHLDALPRTLKPGDRIARGAVLATSGNSGRSFAPHLHYQLMTGDDRVLDPFEQHRTYRRSVAAGRRAAFEAEAKRLEGLLATALAGR